MAIRLDPNSLWRFSAKRLRQASIAWLTTPLLQVTPRGHPVSQAGVTGRHSTTTGVGGDRTRR